MSISKTYCDELKYDMYFDSKYHGVVATDCMHQSYLVKDYKYAIFDDIKVNIFLE
jgi:hypothetical protein